MSPSDTELMLRVKRGDRSAFDNLVRRHQHPLVNFFFRLAWDRFEAEDLAQEVFLRIFLSAGTYEPRARFTTFLYRVARNLWIDRIRARKVRPREVGLPGSSARAESSGAAPVSAQVQSSQEQLEAAELQERLARAAQQLPPEQQLVLWLGEQQGFRYQEIADILEIPVGTVKSRMHAAVTHLRRVIGSRHEESRK